MGSGVPLSTFNSQHSTFNTRLIRRPFSREEVLLFISPREPTLLAHHCHERQYDYQRHRGPDGLRKLPGPAPCSIRFVHSLFPGGVQFSDRDTGHRSHRRVEVAGFRRPAQDSPRRAPSVSGFQETDHRAALSVGQTGGLRVAESLGKRLERDQPIVAHGIGKQRDIRRVIGR